MNHTDVIFSIYTHVIAELILILTKTLLSFLELVLI